MITILQSFLVFLFAFVRFRWALFVFLFLLPFMPRYLSLAVGSEGLALSARRIILMFLVLTFMLWAVYDGHKAAHLYKLIRSSIPLFLLLAVLYAVKIVATLIGSGVASLLYVADDLLSAVPVMLMIMMVTKNIEDRRWIFLMMVLGMLGSEMLALVEYFKQAPLIHGMIDLNVKVDEKVLEGHFRNETYRSSALFDTPLLLSEFVCISWPFSWYFIRYANSRIEKGIAIASLILAPVTQPRSRLERFGHYNVLINPLYRASTAFGTRFKVFFGRTEDLIANQYRSDQGTNHKSNKDGLGQWV